LLPSADAVDEDLDRDDFFDDFSLACEDFDLPLFIDDDDDLPLCVSTFLDDDDPMPGDSGLPFGVSPFLDDDPMPEENDADRDNVLCLVAFL